MNYVKDDIGTRVGVRERARTRGARGGDGSWMGGRGVGSEQ